MAVLVTGGCGFIGSNFIRYLLKKDPNVRVVNLDRLTYAGNAENLSDLESDPRYKLVRGDIADPETVESIFAGEEVTGVVNFAAESHVDRSIDSAADFVRTNVMGTQVLLDAARRHKAQRFVHVSTDEVYGSLGKDGKFLEETPLSPNSPYSASKAASDLLVRAAFQTHGFPAVITRCSNNYGAYQFPEKLIPLFITNAMEDKPLPLYGDGLNVRDWIHVEDHCRGLDRVLEAGVPGEVYNIGGNSEKTNLEITQRILKELGKPESLIRFVQDRPGHDRRYAIDATKMDVELGWSPIIPFEQGIRMTVQWYVKNRGWWERIKSGEYRDYYDRQYGARLR